MSIQRILVIEDDRDMATLIQHKLSKEGYDVQLAYNGEDGLLLAQRSTPDLVILDRVLPRMNGIEVCHKLRQKSDVPILMLTAKSDVDDRVEGLDAGANDYLGKPFDPRELMARVRAQLRHGGTAGPKMMLNFGNLSMNTHTRETWREGSEIALSPKEFELLVFFMNHPRQVLSKSHIIESVWGWDYEGNENIVEVYMRNLRKKIDQTGHSKLLHTVHGVGYVLRD